MALTFTGGVVLQQGDFTATITSGGGSFSANAVNFDGTNDFLTRDAQLTGVADNAQILMSLWFKIDDAANDGNTLALNRSRAGQISIQKNATDKLKIYLQSTSTILWQIDSNGLFNSTNNTGWHNILVSADLDSTPVAHVYLDDVVLDSTIITGPLEGLIDYTVIDWAIGATESGGAKMTGDLAEVYTINEFLDISIEANRRKFIDVNGFPVDLGSDGSSPTGMAPLMFFSGDTNSWHINKGTGGGFTENGALTDASSSPSD